MQVSVFRSGILFTKPFLGFIFCVVLALNFGCAKRREYHLVSPPSAGLLGEMTSSIAAGDYDKIEAVIVERGGEIRYEAYFGSTDAQSRIDARSAGKSITALAVGVAMDEGKIASVQTPVLDYFGDKAPITHDGLAKRSITLEDLLTMSSALDCNDWRPSPGNEERMYLRNDWTRFALDLPIDTSYRRGKFGRGRYSYCTAGAFLLGRVIERATGVRFDNYVQKKLFDPLDISDPIWRRAPNGEVQSGGQLSLRARDFMALGRMMLNKGRHGERTIVSREWLMQMLQPRLTATPRDSYSYLWWIRDFCSVKAENAKDCYPGFYMLGNGGNKMVIFPHLDAVVVILSTNYNQGNMHDLSTALIERFVLPVLGSSEGGAKTVVGRSGKSSKGSPVRASSR